MEQSTIPYQNITSAQNNTLYDKINKDAFLELVDNIRKIYSTPTLADSAKLDERDKLIEKWNDNYFEYLKSKWMDIMGCGPFPNYQNNTTHIRSLLTDRNFHRPEYIFTEKQDCSVNLSNIDLPGAILKNISFKNGNLDNANLYGTTMKNIDFSNANLEKTVMHSSNLYKVELYSANLKSANLFSVIFDDCLLSRSNLTGVNFGESEFKDSACRWALFDGGTVFYEVKVDNNTDFTGSPIRNAAISPELLTTIEDNIREIRWRRWYDKEKFADIGTSYRLILKIVQVTVISVLLITIMWILNVLIGGSVMFIPLLESLGGFAIFLCLISVSRFYTVCTNICMKCFWKLTNYGRTTSGILIAYLVWTMVFTTIYYIFATPSLNDGFIDVIISISLILLQTAISGFYPDFLIASEINPEFQLIWMLVVCIHLIGSYFLLATLVARFSVLLNSLSP